MEKDSDALPLLHPAILIPTAPKGQPIDGPDGKSLIRWGWTMVKYCVPHARMMLNELKDDSLNARVFGED